jgi:hypothetical protein
VLSPPSALNCVVVDAVMPGGRTRPRTVVAEDGAGELHRVVLKLRFPDAACGDGHFEGTSLACELACSALARHLGFHVPDYAIVAVTPALADAQPTEQLRCLFSRNVGPCFGSVHLHDAGPWQPPTGNITDRRRETLASVLAFDATVLNGDRSAGKPNLLSLRDDVYLIDHSLALPVHHCQPVVVPPGELLPDSYLHGHCTYATIASKGSAFDSCVDPWQHAVDASALAQIRSWIPREWERVPGDLDRMFSFLAERPLHLRKISTHLAQVVK